MNSPHVKLVEETSWFDEWQLLEAIRRRLQIRRQEFGAGLQSSPAQFVEDVDKIICTHSAQPQILFNSNPQTYELEGNSGTALFLTPIKDGPHWTFANAATSTSVLNIWPHTEVGEVVQRLEKSGNLLTLSQVDEVIEAAKTRSRKNQLFDNHQSTFFFIETGDTNNPVKVAVVSGWKVTKILDFDEARPWFPVHTLVIRKP